MAVEQKDHITPREVRLLEGNPRELSVESTINSVDAVTWSEDKGLLSRSNEDHGQALLRLGVGDDIEINKGAFPRSGNFEAKDFSSETNQFEGQGSKQSVKIAEVREANMSEYADLSSSRFYHNRTDLCKAVMLESSNLSIKSAEELNVYRSGKCTEIDDSERDNVFLESKEFNV